MRQLMAAAIRGFGALTVAAMAVACGGGSSALSGRYVGEVEGTTMEFNFLGDGKATFGMSAGGSMERVDCTYQEGETLISVNCVGSSGISLTRVDGGLEANMGGVLVRYKKQ